MTAQSLAPPNFFPAGIRGADRILTDHDSKRGATMRWSGRSPVRARVEHPKLTQPSARVFEVDISHLTPNWDSYVCDFNAVCVSRYYHGSPEMYVFMSQRTLPKKGSPFHDRKSTFRIRLITQSQYVSTPKKRVFTVCKYSPAIDKKIKQFTDWIFLIQEFSSDVTRHYKGMNTSENRMP